VVVKEVTPTRLMEQLRPTTEPEDAVRVAAQFRVSGR
jgi:hypothetical protein